MFQQALVDYMTDPTTTNHRITEIVDAMHDAGQFWQVNDELNNDATQRMIDNKLVSDAGNGYVGDMDCVRVQALIDEFVPILQAANKADGLKERTDVRGHRGQPVPRPDHQPGLLSQAIN